MKQNSPQDNIHYDVVVVGAGSGGLTTAIGFAAAGKKVLVIEKNMPGGECTHSGCIPSKALLHQAKKMYESENIDAVHALEITRERIDYVYTKETPEVLAQHGVDYKQGEGVFTGTHSIQVDEVTYIFKKAVIATGSAPRMITIEGLDTQDILTNQNLFEQKKLPKKLLIIGSGPIGMEMAQACRLLGSQVTIATIDDRFARLEEREVASVLETHFNTLGIKIVLQANIVHVTGKTAHFEIIKDDRVIDTVDVEFDKVLIAIGRVPHIPEGLEHAGVDSTPHGININKQYQTTNKDIFAIGDVSQRLKFTHTANDAGRAVVQHILTYGLWKARTNKAVPKVTYTSPEVAQVGMNYHDACKKYGEDAVVKVSVPFSQLDRATTDFAERGCVVLVARRLSGTILGVNIVGEHAGELLAPFTVAIDHGLSVWKLRSTIFPYPTLSEITRKVCDAYFQYTIANLKSDIVSLVKRNLPKIIAGIIWGVFLLWFYMFKSEHNYSYTDMFMMLYGFLSTHMLGPVLYMGLYTLRPVLFFPASVMTILGGVLFGPLYGVLYTIVGSNASASLAYWIGRFFAHDIHLEDNKLFGVWIQKARDNPLVSIVTMRFIYLPYDLVNYGSGVARINWLVFALGTMISILPGTLTFVLLGASLDVSTIAEAQNFSDLVSGFNVYTFLSAVALFIGTLIFASWYRRRYT